MFAHCDTESNEVTKLEFPKHPNHQTYYIDHRASLWIAIANNFIFGFRLFGIRSFGLLTFAFRRNPGNNRHLQVVGNMNSDFRIDFKNGRTINTSRKHNRQLDIMVHIKNPELHPRTGHYPGTGSQHKKISFGFQVFRPFSQSAFRFRLFAVYGIALRL